VPEKKLTAKERKQQAAEKSREAVKKSKGRRSGRVTTYVSHKAKKPGRPKRAINPAFVPKMEKPKGLSDEARFMELRPAGWSPIDWLRLFTPDEELWEAIVEEAEYERDNAMGR
jgi:hypothetical protein